jgi:tryptophan synthase alpha chain
MLNAASAALSFIEGQPRQSLDRDLQRLFALVRALEVIDEAAGHVARPCRERHPQIDWKLLIGLKAMHIADDFEVDVDQLWRTVTHDLPPLVAELEKILLGANPLLEALKTIRASGRMALCGYFLAGYPTPDAFFHMVRAARDLDVIEFGIPSDDPALDGTIIARAHQVVTAQRGIHAETALALIGGLRAIPQPRFVMTYAAVGRALDGFLQLCVDNSVAGVLAPDADPIEGAFIAHKARGVGLASVALLDARADDATVKNCVELGDMIYVKAAPGKTGTAADIDGDLRDLLASAIDRIRALNPVIPICVGIGLQRPEQVAALATLGVDMAIVGTKLVEYLDAGEDSLVNYIASLRAATHFPA